MPQMPNLRHLSIGESRPLLPQGAGPGPLPAASLGSASHCSRPAVPGVSLRQPGSLRVTSDLQTQMETDSSFVPSTEPDGLRDFAVLPAPASSALPDPLEFSTMGDLQNLGHPQNQQTCKYDLLSSVPRE